MLICEGFAFIKDRSSTQRSNWKCSLFKRLKCKARAITQELDGIEYYRLTHSIHTHSREDHRINNLKKSDRRYKY